MRRPRSLPLRARAWRLRVAGLAECRRLRELEEDDPEPTAVVEFETMRELVNGREAA